MSIINSNLLVGPDSNAKYEISRSLRFNELQADSINRNPRIEGNRSTWTYSAWVKIDLATRRAINQILWSATTFNGSDHDALYVNSTDDQLVFVLNSSSGVHATIFKTLRVFRDPNAWQHIVLRFDSTGAAPYVRLWVNGGEVTQFSVDQRNTIIPNHRTAFNSLGQHRIGRSVSGTDFLNGYVADVHVIDGQALTASDFGEWNLTTGVWVPKAYKGSYGTNGFHLDFSDNSTIVTLGKDSSGNGNDWTLSNITTRNSFVDVPVNGEQPDTGLGGEVRGNYCTMNPLFIPNNSLYTEGNLQVVTTTESYTALCGTFAMPSGKWYWEVKWESGTTGLLIGIWPTTNYSSNRYIGDVLGSYAYYSTNGQRVGNNQLNHYGSTYSINDVIGVAFDADAGTLSFYKNGVNQGVAFTGIPVGPSKQYFPAFSKDTSSPSYSTVRFNFGQSPFAYPAPSGYKCLCTANLPEPAIKRPATAMQARIYTGNGANHTISGMLFSPDLVWIKHRSSATYGHCIFDRTRQANYWLSSATNAEEKLNTSSLQAFNSDGFTLANAFMVNQSANSYISWSWDAGESLVTNTDGSISSQVRANPKSGFSIVTYDGSSAISSIGHGLGAKPELIIIKNRTVASTDWVVGSSHFAVASPWNYNMKLNSTDMALSEESIWYNYDPTSSIFYVGTNSKVNATDNKYVAYCFAPVDGFSSFGYYKGNSSPNGQFVYTGFMPRFIMLKCTTGSLTNTANWIMIDGARVTSNPSTTYSVANLASAEQTNIAIDFLSNGFKIRTDLTVLNDSAHNYFYAAFAQQPLKYATAR